MPVMITCRNTKLDDHLQGLVEKKSRNLKKYFDKVDKIEIVFSAEKHRRECEINVHAAPFSLTARAENATEGHAFDKALKTIQRQIRDRKNKMIDKTRRGKGAPDPIADLEEVVEEEDVRDTA
ncbi:MAG: ribosome-associated translation inhibitor RaiA [Candidatus Sumerlaeia bacterium]|nr:ribosome-associated translation inhibitor RaiA [Candidatus Sumerlaeia bacterium]